MAGQINISGSTEAVQLHGNDDYTVARDFTFPDASGELLIKDANDNVPGVGAINGGQLAGFRNQIINGDFNIAQRGTNFSSYTDSDEYTLDRWHINTTSTRIQQDDGGPLGFAKHVIMYQVGSPAGSTKQQITQQIELPAPGRAGAFVNGSTWTISYWARLNGAPSTNNPFSVIVKYTRGSGTTSSVNADFLNASQAFTTDWVRYSHTFTITKDPEADDTCMGVFFICNPGVNVAVRLTGVQLEPGSVATMFEHRPIGTELALCQRYFELVSGGDGVPLVGDGNGGTTKQTVLPFKTQKRVLSTVTAVNASIKNDGAIVTATLAFGDTNGLGAFIYATSIAGGTWGSSTQFRCTSLTADAEL